MKNKRIKHSEKVTTALLYILMLFLLWQFIAMYILPLVYVNMSPDPLEAAELPLSSAEAEMGKLKKAKILLYEYYPGINSGDVDIFAVYADRTMVHMTAERDKWKYLPNGVQTFENVTAIQKQRLSEPRYQYIMSNAKMGYKHGIPLVSEADYEGNIDDLRYHGNRYQADMNEFFYKLIDDITEGWEE